MGKLQKGLFIFHRDFRIVDNVGLMKASKMVESLYVCFIQVVLLHASWFVNVDILLTGG